MQKMAIATANIQELSAPALIGLNPICFLAQGNSPHLMVQAVNETFLCIAM
jgi:hypothetical protein